MKLGSSGGIHDESIILICKISCANRALVLRAILNRPRRSDSGSTCGIHCSTVRVHSPVPS